MSAAQDLHPCTRVGMLGGAFDPPHQGHWRLAQTALEQLKLDVLHIVPTGQAWHKARTLTPAVHRLAMTQLTFANIPRVYVDEREIQRQGLSYTADTLQELALEYPGALLFLVLGEDQANALLRWHRWHDIAQLATVCIAQRADFLGARDGLDILESRISTLIRLNMPAVALSSTQVREHWAMHAHTANLGVLDDVARYIERHHLYRWDENQRHHEHATGN